MRVNVKKNLILSILMSLLVFIGTLFSSFGSSAVFVQADSVSGFDKVSVLNDLENSIIQGKEFSVKDYNFDTRKETQVISFFEYCYSFYESLQSEFALYVYVYNPKALNFDEMSPLNSISLKIGETTSDSWSKYQLSVVNVSQGDYYGLFYKMKVVLTDDQKQSILNKVNSTERVYSVSEVELFEKGQTNAVPVPVSGVFKFSGYMSGFGSNTSAENSLKCIEARTDTISLDVHPTTYRPSGTNGKNNYTQDSLHSVYFAVPNEFVESYGEMVSVHARWRDAVLTPALVTGNQDALSAISNFLGAFVGESGVPESGGGEDFGESGGGGFGGGGGGIRSLSLDSLDYGYIGAYSDPIGSPVIHSGGIAYLPEDFKLGGAEVYERRLNYLFLLFDSGSEQDSADSYTVSSESIITELKNSYQNYGGTLVNSKYSNLMFDRVASTWTDKTITRTDEYSLESEVLGSSFWDKMWGITVTESFKDIKAIHTLSDSDFTNDLETDCKNLYVGKQDYNNLKKYYDDHKNDSTIFLFRYQVSDYISQEATLFERKTFLGIDTWKSLDTNAYFFQETVNLDFDIIDLTFSTGETETVIPVVMKPIDIIPDATPPVYTESDEEEWWKIVIALVAIVLLLVLYGTFLAPIVNPIIKAIFNLILNGLGLIIKGVFSILTFPLRLLFGLFKK